MNAMNEFDFLKKLKEQARDRGSSAGLVRGIGDDAAVFKPLNGGDVVITADLLVEDIDFRQETTRPELLGHKSLAVSLSDIAAMGARPRWALLSLAVTNDVWDSEFLDQFYQGFFRLAERFGVKLIGGDLSRTDSKILIDSLVLGLLLRLLGPGRAGSPPHVLVRHPVRHPPLRDAAEHAVAAARHGHADALLRKTDHHRGRRVRGLRLGPAHPGAQQLREPRLPGAAGGAS